jgi:YidC/Oxa1 family membrane protein insertase
VGLVDHRPDRDRAHPARSDHRQADPLDAVPSGARAGDEGAAAEVEARQAAAKRRAHEVLQENKINPAASCLPIVLQIPIFISLFYVLREFEKDVLPQYGGAVDWLGLVDITENIGAWPSWGPLLLVIYVASQLSSSYFMSSTMQGPQRIMLMVLPIVFVPFILAFPAGLMLYWLTTNLWTTGQGLVTRKLMPKPAPPEKRSSRTPAKDEPPENGSSTKQKSAEATPAPSRPRVAGPPRRVKRKSGGGGAKK